MEVSRAEQHLASVERTLRDVADAPIRLCDGGSIRKGRAERRGDVGQDLREEFLIFRTSLIAASAHARLAALPSASAPVASRSTTAASSSSSACAPAGRSWRIRMRARSHSSEGLKYSLAGSCPRLVTAIRSLSVRSNAELTGGPANPPPNELTGPCFPSVAFAVLGTIRDPLFSRRAGTDKLV